MDLFDVNEFRRVEDILISDDCSEITDIICCGIIRAHLLTYLLTYRLLECMTGCCFSCGCRHDEIKISRSYPKMGNGNKITEMFTNTHTHYTLPQVNLIAVSIFFVLRLTKTDMMSMYTRHCFCFNSARVTCLVSMYNLEVYCNYHITILVLSVVEERIMWCTDLYIAFYMDDITELLPLNPKALLLFTLMILC